MLKFFLNNAFFLILTVVMLVNLRVKGKFLSPCSFKVYWYLKDIWKLCHNFFVTLKFLFKIQSIFFDAVLVEKNIWKILAMDMKNWHCYFTVDIEVKRGTQAAIEQEEAERRQREEARKKEKYAIKFKRERKEDANKIEEDEKSDEGDDVSDEDLSQYGDFVYQACEEEDDDLGLLLL